MRRDIEITKRDDDPGYRTTGTDSLDLPEAYDALTAFLRAEIAAGFRRVQK
jgi:hypothetical protein